VAEYVERRKVSPSVNLGGGASYVEARCPMLEPYDAKVSRTVLRGLGGGNVSRLPGAVIAPVA